MIKPFNLASPIGNTSSRRRARRARLLAGGIDDDGILLFVKTAPRRGLHFRLTMRGPSDSELRLRHFVTADDGRCDSPT